MSLNRHTSASRNTFDFFSILLYRNKPGGMKDVVYKAPGVEFQTISQRIGESIYLFVLTLL